VLVLLSTQAQNTGSATFGTAAFYPIMTDNSGNTEGEGVCSVALAFNAVTHCGP